MDDIDDNLAEDVFMDEAPRIAVVGPMASGKTTLARQLAERLALPHVDCDALFWEADWTPAPVHVLRQHMTAALAPDRWVIDGNIGRLRDLQLSRITTLVWLDYPLHTCMPRLLRRTLRRVLLCQPTHGGNRETFTQQFLSRDSVFLFLPRQHAGLRRHYEEMIAAPDAQHVHVVRLRSPAETRRWMEGSCV